MNSTSFFSARDGNVQEVEQLLESRQNGSLSFDINAKGVTKATLGWTPLHLAAYFGHSDVVSLLLEVINILRSIMLFLIRIFDLTERRRHKCCEQYWRHATSQGCLHWATG